jgi:hypothetical protein
MSTPTTVKFANCQFVDQNSTFEGQINFEIKF